MPIFYWFRNVHCEGSILYGELCNNRQYCHSIYNTSEPNEVISHLGGKVRSNKMYVATLHIVNYSWHLNHELIRAHDRKVTMSGKS